LVRTVLDAAATCKAGSLRRIFRRPRNRARESRGITRPSPRSRGPSSTFCGTTRSVATTVLLAKRHGSVALAEAFS